MQQLLELDQALWIVGLCILLAHIRGPARDVTERPQPLDGLRRFGPGACGRRDIEPLQQLEHDARAARIPWREVVRFSGISGEVVQLGNGQVDVLLVPGDDAA